MEGKPLCLLTLDGGGIRGLSELLILEQIMKRIKDDLNMTTDPLPADFFDLIGGTSTGGLIALLLGRVRLSVPEAIDAYVRIAQDVFSMTRYLKKSKFDGQKLEAAVKQVLEDRFGDGRGEERMLDPTDGACKVFVCAARKDDVAARAGPTLFRTYNVRERASFNCTIWEASRATSAAPTYFDPISIGRAGMQAAFVDGGLGCNNPIEQALDEARRVFPKRMVACIVSIGTGLAPVIRFPDSTSPLKLVDALKRMATDSDVTAERVQARFHDTDDIYFRFNVDRGLEDIELDEWQHMGRVETYTAGYVDQATVSRQIDTVVKALLASKVEPGSDRSTAEIRIHGPSSGVQLLPWRAHDPLPDFHHKIEDVAHVVPSVRDLQSKNRVWSVPFQKNLSFTGRRSELEKLRVLLFIKDQTAKVGITGLGGIGKTQLALAMAYQIRDEYEDCSIFWIPCTSRDSIEKAYVNVARLLGIPGAEDDKANVITLVRDHLSQESAGRWLLVFDNADDIGIWIGGSQSAGAAGAAGEHGRLKDHLPKSPGRGSIIFTTRDKKAATTLVQKNVIQLTELDETGSKEILRNYLANTDLLNNEEDTTALLTKLTYLPLAIVQAAAYINKNTIGLDGYLSLLDEQEEDVIELLSEDFEDEGRYSRAKNPVATTWLISFEQIRKHDPRAARYLAFMACVDANDIPRSLLPECSTKKEGMDAIGTLKAYSFISSPTPDAPINIHRLVHLATRNWLRNKGQLPDWTRHAITTLDEAFSKTDYGKISEWRSYMPHAYHALQSSVEDENSKYRLSLLGWYAFYLFHDGRYAEAEKSFDRVVFLSKTKLGADHPVTLASMNNLASTYRHQDRGEEAENLAVQMIETSKTKLGVDHPVTLTSIANLALTYQTRGRWEEAEKLQVQGMETRKAKLGADHPSTLRIMANLALTYKLQGRWEEAEKLGIQVIKARKAKLGVDHPDTLASMSNLASTWKHQGRDSDALELMKDCFSRYRRVLGSEHPRTLKSMAHLENWS